MIKKKITHTRYALVPTYILSRYSDLKGFQYRWLTRGFNCSPEIVLLNRLVSVATEDFGWVTRREMHKRCTGYYGTHIIIFHQLSYHVA